MVILDPPSPTIIESPYAVFRGWAPFQIDGHDFTIEINNLAVEYSQEIRVDLPGIFGFNAYVDFVSIPSSEKYELRVIDICCQKSEYSASIFVSPDFHEKIRIESHYRLLRRKFIWENLTKSIPVNLNEIDNRVSDETSIPLTQKSDPISANGYGKELWDFLSTFDDDSRILEAGAGFRFEPVNRPLIINQELFRYPSTDLACDLHNIPLADNCFDGAIISAVFEHVQNPFEVASELCRVIKPKGRIYVDVPFLQAEHGFPHHYFNMTRMGVQEIFREKAQLIHQSIAEINQTKYSIFQLINLFINAASKNDPKLNRRFMKMRLKDFLKTIDSFKLNEEDDFKTAWGTTSIFEVL